MSLRKLGLYCGIASPILWLALIGICGALRPNFSHVTQLISELGEGGSSTELLMRAAGFGLTGFLYPCFAAALAATYRRRWIVTVACVLIALDGMGRMGAGVFPCDPGCVRISEMQDLHKLFATIGFISGILAAIVCGVLCRRIAVLRPLSWPSIVSGLAALAALLLMSFSPMGAPGLFEHAASAILSVWLLVFAARLIRNEHAGEVSWRSTDDNS